MELQVHHGLLICQALLALLSIHSYRVVAAVSPREIVLYEKNGVSLIGTGPEPQGRLELLPDPNSFAFTTERVQVCDDGYADAGVMCQLLGFKYGRRYYDASVAFPVNQTNYRAGYVDCIKNTGGGNDGFFFGHRRQLRGNGDPDALASGASSRRILSPSIGFLKISAGAPYACRFRKGTCNPVGPLFGVKCSNKVFPPAPLPPPSPPNPPPSPPAVSNFVRIISPVEPNLCNTSNTGGNEADCTRFWRVEMQVYAPSKKEKIWAPVCNVSNTTLAERVAFVACSQKFQERRHPWLGDIWMISPMVSKTPFIIPKASSVTSNADFKVTEVKGWATISGGDFSKATQLQDLKYKVSTTACARNAMFAFSCGLASIDDNI